ncbi:hypothetical protein C8R43DRAFT_1117160 [Mycena crocata]|nr:hypothetical protein C8R43DRAFT_1117160 [Mycena crocata]
MEQQQESGEPTVGQSKEQEDHRDASDGYMLSRERVDRWAKTRLADVLPMQTGNTDGKSPCAERWKNMVNVTSKMWGIFDKTGIFLALCHHGFVLVLADMLRSGELGKYPLAVVEELLSVFGMNLSAGYNVGCHFGTTVANSELGEEAREKNLCCLVGSFHGHAHNRLCQLSFLATYVEGMGLEDLEGCERFHRQQEITMYVKHFDSFETYPNLSKFLVSNYHQALSILKTEPALARWMQQEGVESTNKFHQWLEEERAYLIGLKIAAKTNVETLEMEYVQRLVNLSASHTILWRQKQGKRRGTTFSFVPGVPKAVITKQHAKEKLERDIETVEELEDLLVITERWTTASLKWIETTVEIKKRKYQQALDALELLIVERIFELTKMNQSQTGYKIAAIDRYNTAAMLLDLPIPVLSWDQIVEYAFLADFDILQDTRAEVRQCPWTRPAYRLAMDRYFKILRAREEIKRLNASGKSKERVLEDIQMAVQRFWKLGGTPGFTGSLRPGVSVEQHAAQRQAVAARTQAAQTEGSLDEDKMEVDEVVVDAAGGRWSAQGEADDEEEFQPPRPIALGEESDEEGEGLQAQEERVSELMHSLAMLAVDDGGMQRAGT